MTEYEFACPSCGQQIEVNASVRDAILTNGCPVCSTSITTDHFEDDSRS